METTTAITATEVVNALQSEGINRVWIDASGNVRSNAGTIYVASVTAFDAAATAASWKAIDWRCTLPAERRRGRR